MLLECETEFAFTEAHKQLLIYCLDKYSSGIDIVNIF